MFMIIGTVLYMVVTNEIVEDAQKQTAKQDGCQW